MYLPSLFLLYFFLLSVAFLELLSDLELVFPSCLRLKQEEWIPGMVLQGFGSFKDIIIETQTPKDEQPTVKLPGIQWIPPESYEIEDIILDLDDWNPPMILEEYGSFKETSFESGYELQNSTEGRGKLVKTNCPIIKKWKIPITIKA